jgi:hypothetical protein
MLLSTGYFGDPALTAFNEFGGHTGTSKVATVLLLGSKQQDWAGKATVSSHHVSIVSPIKVPQLLRFLEQHVAEHSATAHG